MLEAQTVGQQLERLKIEQEPTKLKCEQAIQHLQATFSGALSAGSSCRQGQRDQGLLQSRPGTGQNHVD